MSQVGLSYHEVDLSQKHHRQERSASDYQQHTLLTQIYAKPGMYIGSCERMERDECIFDFQTRKMIKCKLDYPEGIDRLFLEIISNAADNAYASRRFGVDPGSISVQMDQN